MYALICVTLLRMVHQSTLVVHSTSELIDTFSEAIPFISNYTQDTPKQDCRETKLGETYTGTVSTPGDAHKGWSCQPWVNQSELGDADFPDGSIKAAKKLLQKHQQ